MKEIRVGLLGFGTVGTGVVEGIQKNADLIAERTGVKLIIAAVADLDLETDRGVVVDKDILTTDAVAVVEREDIDVIVELMGGTGIAREMTLKALKLGKPVVTANKALLAEYGEEIFKTAEENEVDLYYEASVAGGIPIIRALREGLVANHIEHIYGILNGTCNYILTRMEEDGLMFEAALNEAQIHGFAEAEPSLDIDGIDTAHKAVILAGLSYGFPIAMEEIYVEGLRKIEPLDIYSARQLGYCVKLLAVIRQEDGDVDIRVHPALVPEEHALAAVSGEYNAVLVQGDVVGQTMYYGKGAGRDPTASAVLSDLVDVGRNLKHDSSHRVPAFVAHKHYGRLKDIGEIECRYYIRMLLHDQPGAIAEVARVLGEHNINIASIVQQEDEESRFIPVTILTHRAVEKDFQQALEAMKEVELVGEDMVYIRILDM